MKKKELTPDFLIARTRQLLEIWIVDKDKEKAYDYFMSFSPQERVLINGALKDIISQTNVKGSPGMSLEFRQAAKDIPAYIKSKIPDR